MTKQNIKTYNWANLFANVNGGKPMLKEGHPIKDKNGQLILIPSYTCVISINQDLPKGEYEIKFRERVAQTGTTYFGGGILPKEQKVNNYKPNKHYQVKANGYQLENKGLVKPPVEDKEFIDDELPF